MRESEQALASYIRNRTFKVLFTRQQFNWGTVLNFSEVVKVAMFDKILQENLDSRKQLLSFHTRYILLNVTIMLQLSKGPLLNCSRVKFAFLGMKCTFLHMAAFWVNEMKLEISCQEVHVCCVVI